MGEITTIPKTNYTVRTAAYEGPFELLLDLIEKRKLLVSDISLATVTDEYIEHVRSTAAFPMEDATNFIAVAATLLLIKSKSLIPELELSEEETESVSDLQMRLALYEKARDAARELSRLFGKTVLVSAGERDPEPLFTPSKDLSPSALATALSEALMALQKTEQLPEARVVSTVTIEEMMDNLLSRVQSALTISFKEFSKGHKERVDVIVSFLALLELVKQGAVHADQYDHFGDIKITNTSAGVPKYGV